jgi:CheY-like chemotaxis protein
VTATSSRPSASESVCTRGKAAFRSPIPEFLGKTRRKSVKPFSDRPIILSDFKMPGMDGEHFFEALSVVAPECIERVGFITGDAMSENVRSFFLSSGRPYIEKPVLKDELFDLIEGLSAEYEEG